MTRTLAFVLAVVSPILLVSTPAFATKGIDAARVCEATPGCRLLLHGDGTITIYVNGHTIYCTGPQDDCHVLGIRAGANRSVTVLDALKKR